VAKDINKIGANDSIIGLTVDELGGPTVKVKHRDGTEETNPLEEESTKHTHSPHTWKQPRTGPLTEEPRFGLTRAEHVARSLRVEAALIEIFGGTGDITKERLEKHSYQALLRIIKAMGYDDKIQK